MGNEENRSGRTKKCTGDGENAQVEPKSAQVTKRTAQVDSKSARLTARTAQVEPESARVTVRTDQVEPKSAQVTKRTAQVTGSSVQVESKSTQAKRNAQININNLEIIMKLNQAFTQTLITAFKMNEITLTTISSADIFYYIVGRYIVVRYRGDLYDTRASAINRGRLLYFISFI